MSLAYNQRPVITFPSSPTAATADFSNAAVVGIVSSIFTGAQQVQTWSPGWLEIDLGFPPMKAIQAAAFEACFMAANGSYAVFTLPTWLQNLVPTGLAPTGYWCLRDQETKYSVNVGMMYGIRFVIRSVVSP